jgi:acyl carrier protein
MNREQVFAHVVEALEAALEEPVTIRMETHLVDDGVLDDSLDGMRFLFELEKRVGIEFPDDDLPDGKLFVIANVVDYVLEARGEGADA